MVERVGFIGLGAIGRPMAMHVAKRFETMVWNRTADKAAKFAKEFHCKAAESPREVIRWADVVVTCLPTSKEVRAIVTGTKDAWKQGQLLVDATSGDPATSGKTAADLAKKGVGFVDAPVSGGTSGAEAGKLTVMLGGEAKWIPMATEVVNAFAAKVVHVGPVGAGHAVKAINNALLAINVIAAGEGLAALVKLGVSGQAAVDVINASSGRSNVTENLIPQRVLNRAWPRTFRLALLDKDVGIASDILDQQGVPNKMIAAAKAEYAAARKALGEEADHVELIKLIEKAADVEIRTTSAS